MATRLREGSASVNKSSELLVGAAEPAGSAQARALTCRKRRAARMASMANRGIEMHAVVGFYDDE